MRRALASIVILTLLSAEAAAMENWIAAAKILRNSGTSGSGIYLRSGLIITAAHLTGPNSKMGATVAGVSLPAQILKQGALENVDLSLLKVDDEKLSAIALPQMQLCVAPPWPGDPVIVVDAERTSISRIVSPQVLPFVFRTKFTTLIADVANTGNSGSGVFDPARKCLLGIMSRKFAVGGKDIAKYFVPAAEIRNFLPAEFKSQF